jgi:stage V sporulation protein B
VSSGTDTTAVTPSADGHTGSGVLWLTAAKLYFMVTGVVLVLFLPALFKRFGGQDHVHLYGDYRTVVSLVNWFNMVLIGGTLPMVAKFVAERDGRTHAVKWTALGLQTVIGGLAALLLFAGAGTLASRYYQDSGLAPHLRLAAPIVLLYGYYAVVIGCMNGLRRFRHQATMDILFATLKVGLTVVLVALGLQIQGAIGALLFTACVALLVSWMLLGRQPRGEGVPWKTLLAFEWKTLLFAFFLNGLLQIDLQLLKGLAPSSLGDTSLQTGIYGAMQQIATLPYVATIAVAFVVFPLVSRSTFDEDMETTRRYVTTTNRFVAILLTAVVSVVALFPEALIQIVYPGEYLAGVPSLRILAVGYLFFSGMVLNANILTGAGRPLEATAWFGGTMVLSVALNVWLVPAHGGVGASIAATLAMAAGFLGLAMNCKRRFGVFMPMGTALRILLAAAAVAGIRWVAFPAIWVEPSGITRLLPLLAMAGFGLLFLAVLALTGEWTVHERETFWRWVRRRFSWN